MSSLYGKQFQYEAKVTGLDVRKMHKTRRVSCQTQRKVPELSASISNEARIAKNKAKR